MLSVLHLYPVLRPTGMIRAITALAHEPFEPHLARGAKEIRPDLFRAACDMGLEGLVSKHWVKVKSRKHPAMDREP